VISKGNVTAAEIVACFEHTNKLLGVQIEYKFCPHNPAPIQCYCRKPMPGLAVEFIHRYKLDWKKTFFVGDMTSDKTFAQRSLIGFVNPEKFFAL
jgi:histidinol phosphatase-like enzyme